MTSSAYNSDIAIELNALDRRYGAFYVLRDLNLTVTAGKVVVLQGGNGSGKTTLLKVLSTRLTPSRGSGRVFGFDLSRESAQVRERVAYLQVLGGSYGTLTALENLRLAAQLYQTSTDPDVLGTLIDDVGLSDARDQLVRTFSSGMKKRLGIARLLLADADLWLLDEPYAALDEEGKRLIDALLVRAKHEAKTVVMASHELERSARFADSVLRIAQGQLFSVPRAVAEVAHSEVASV